MIDDLDKTLEELLRQELPQNLVEQVTISFATPDDQFPPTSVTLPAVDLFLYDVRENRELRSNEWLVERNAGMATKQRAPVRVDCSYLITAWAGDADSEHRLLGKVMRALLRHPTLPAGVLSEGLRGQEVPLPTSSLQPGRLQSMGEFWQAMEGKPRAALNYTVTIGVEPHEPVEAEVVTEKMLKFRLEKEVAP